jgi:hypothetical protein
LRSVASIVAMIFFVVFLTVVVGFVVVVFVV